MQPDRWNNKHVLCKDLLIYADVDKVYRSMFVIWW